MLLAIDPGRSHKGEASIGYALFHDGREHCRGAMTYDELSDALQPHTGWLALGLSGGVRPVAEVVIENFVNNSQSRGGQTNGTSECIGMVEFACRKSGIPFTRQPPGILSAAKLHAGYEQTLKHLPHQDSAYLHGYYYLVGKGVLKPKGLSATL